MSDAISRTVVRPADNCWNPSDAPTVFARTVYVFPDTEMPDASALGSTRGFVQWTDAPLATLWARRALELLDPGALALAEGRWPVRADGIRTPWRPGDPLTPALRVLYGAQAIQFVYASLNLQASGDPAYREWWRKWFSGDVLDVTNGRQYSQDRDFGATYPSVPMEDSFAPRGLALRGNAVRVLAGTDGRGRIVDDNGAAWTGYGDGAGPNRVGELRMRAIRRFRAAYPGHAFTLRFFAPVFVDYLGLMETSRHPLSSGGPLEDADKLPRDPATLRALWAFAMCATAPLGPRGWRTLGDVWLANPDPANDASRRTVIRQEPWADTAATTWTPRGDDNMPSPPLRGPDTWQTTPLDLWTADGTDVWIGEPTLSVSCTLRDAAEALYELARIVQADPAEIVLRARRSILARNTLTIQALGSRDEALRAFMTADATAYRANHAPDATVDMIGRGIAASAGLAAAAGGVGLPLAVALAAIGAATTAVNATGVITQITHGADATVPRDEFGRHKTWLESAWLSGNVDGPDHSVPIPPEFVAALGSGRTLAGIRPRVGAAPPVRAPSPGSHEVTDGTDAPAMPGVLKLGLFGALLFGGYKVATRRGGSK